MGDENDDENGTKFKCSSRDDVEMIIMPLLTGGKKTEREEIEKLKKIKEVKNQESK